MTRELLDKRYDAAMDAFRAVSRTHRENAVAYRCGKLSDEGFAESLQALKDAQADMDREESLYIEAVNMLDV